MGLEQTVYAINKTVNFYENLLNSVSEEEFKKTPADGVWSYSEVFSHLFRSNMSCFTAIERCSKGQGIEDSKATKLKYKLVLFFRRFPPNMRFKVPEKLAHLVEKIDKTEAGKMISDFRNGLATITEQVRNASPTQKLKHPRMELLNARDWLIFIEVHTKHHARQLKRIMKMLG